MSRLRLTILSLSVVLLWGCTPDTLEQGEAQFNRKQYDSAIKNLTRGLEEKKDSWFDWSWHESLLYVAKHMSADEHYWQARKFFEESDLNKCLQEVEVSLNQRKDHSGSEVLQSRIGGHKKKARTKRDLGKSLLDETKFDAALAVLETVANDAKWEPKIGEYIDNSRTGSFNAHLEEGKKKFKKEDYEGAAGEFVLAASRKPADPNCREWWDKSRWHWQAGVVTRKGDEALKLKEYAKAFDLYKDAQGIVKGFRAAVVGEKETRKAWSAALFATAQTQVKIRDQAHLAMANLRKALDLVPGLEGAPETLKKAERIVAENLFKQAVAHVGAPNLRSLGLVLTACDRAYKLAPSVPGLEELREKARKAYALRGPIYLYVEVKGKGILGKRLAEDLTREIELLGLDDKVTVRSGLPGQLAQDLTAQVRALGFKVQPNAFDILTLRGKVSRNKAAKQSSQKRVGARYWNGLVDKPNATRQRAQKTFNRVQGELGGVRSKLTVAIGTLNAARARHIQADAKNAEALQIKSSHETFNGLIRADAAMLAGMNLPNGANATRRYFSSISNRISQARSLVSTTSNELGQAQRGHTDAQRGYQGQLSQCRSREGILLANSKIVDREPTTVKVDSYKSYSIDTRREDVYAQIDAALELRTQQGELLARPNVAHKATRRATRVSGTHREDERHQNTGDSLPSSSEFHAEQSQRAIRGLISQVMEVVTVHHLMHLKRAEKAGEVSPKEALSEYSIFMRRDGGRTPVSFDKAKAYVEKYLHLHVDQ